MTRFEVIRRGRGLSYTEMAKIFGVHGQTFRTWCRGEHSPHELRVPQVERIMGEKIDALLAHVPDTQ